MLAYGLTQFTCKLVLALDLDETSYTITGALYAG